MQAMSQHMHFMLITEADMHDITDLAPILTATAVLLNSVAYLFAVVRPGHASRRRRR